MIVDGNARRRNEKRNGQEPYRQSRANQRQGKEQSPEMRRMARGERRSVPLEPLRIPAAGSKHLERPQAGKEALEHAGRERCHELHAPDEDEHARRGKLSQNETSERQEKERGARSPFRETETKDDLQPTRPQPPDPPRVVRRDRLG